MGLGLGWSSPAAGIAKGEQGFPVSLEEWSWVSSLFSVGTALGSVAVGKLVLPLGRTLVILSVAPLTFVAFALLHFATEVL